MQVHVPVMLGEVIDSLKIKPDGVYVDGTLGLAGHAREILAKLGPGGRLVGLDHDDQALAIARERLLEYGSQATCIQANFSEMKDVLDQLNIAAVDGILLDLGVSSMQLDKAERGFSFNQEAPLDMRMNPSLPLTAYDIVNRFIEKDLADLIYLYGEERRSRKIARYIVQKREHRPIQTTKELADLIVRAYGRIQGKPKTHPATRTFQALRIAVNEEMDHLHQFLEFGVSCLNPGGRLVVISYHSLEDRPVKQTFKQWASEGLVHIVTKKPMTPSEEEVSENYRSRSAKMRVCERLEVA